MRRIILTMLGLTASATVSAQTLNLPARNFNLEQCLQSAMATMPGTVKSAELEVKDGIAYYEFSIKSFVDGHTWEVECSGDTGAIGKIERDVEKDDEAFKSVAKINTREALQAALKVHDGMPQEVEFEVSPEGRAWYEITVLGRDGSSIEVMVDAATGEVLGAEDESSEREYFRIGDDD
jgi:uncharacterized membrane protein YkoI